jgi:cysteine desulfurase
MFLMKLDIMGVSASGGSACSSGSNIGSHVLAALNIPDDRPNVRFSFSRFNTKEEVDYTVEVLKKMYAPKPAHA